VPLSCQVLLSATPEMEALRSAFRALDVDDSGAVSVSELAEHVSEQDFSVSYNPRKQCSPCVVVAQLQPPPQPLGCDREVQHTHVLVVYILCTNRYVYQQCE
jgi:hypothetical protein